MWVCEGRGRLCGCVREEGSVWVCEGKGSVWVCEGGGKCVGV